MARFVHEMNLSAETTILDIGGFPGTWDSYAEVKGKITILNIHPQPPSDRYTITVGDGTALEYADQSFDIVFSNSVIEHVGGWREQQAFAREALRVGRAVWVQTPAKRFFIEPHLLAVFIHWLPPPTRRKFVRHFSLWGLVTRPSKSEIEEFVAATRLLGYAEMQSLFPGCEIIVERFLGMPKSYIAIRRRG